MAAGEVRLVAIGDSLFAGFGLAPQDGFVAQLQAWLTRRDGAITIANGGVSGDTTTGGLARLDWAVGGDADGVILALGANDMLRGIDPALTRANLAAMLERLQARGLPVLLAGMRAGANLGPEYTDRFDRIYPELAAEYDAVFYPFLLEGVAMDPALNQADGIHPNAAGARVMAAGIGPQVLELANRIRAR